MRGSLEGSQAKVTRQRWVLGGQETTVSSQQGIGASGASVRISIQTSVVSPAPE